MIHALTIPAPPSLLLGAHLLVFATGAWWLQRDPPRTNPGLFSALAIFGVVSLFEFLIAEPPRPFEDFRLAYYPAGAAVLNGPSALLPELERGVEGFVNLPIVAYLFAPLALFPQKYAMLIFAAAGVMAAGLAWWLLVKSAGLPQRGALLLLFLFAACGPLHNSIKEGNTSQFVLALLALGIYLLQSRRDFLGGVTLGLAAIIKLPLVLACAALLLLGRWHAAAGAMIAGLVLFGSSVAIFGVDIHLVWYRECIAPFSSSPLSAFNAQSLHAFVSRLFVEPENLWSWAPQPMPDMYAVLSRTGTILLYLAIAAWLARANFVHARRAGGDHDEARLLVQALSITIILACATSPLSWSHYYAWLLVPIAYLVGTGPFSGRTWHDVALDWLAITLICLPVLDLRPAPGIGLEIYAKIGVSAPLIGGLLLLWSFLRPPTRLPTLKHATVCRGASDLGRF